VNSQREPVKPGAMFALFIHGTIKPKRETIQIKPRVHPMRPKNHFLNDKIATLLGKKSDEIFARQRGTNGIFLSAFH
jgi:hypothetical protein